jgi:hypothetical protein
LRSLVSQRVRLVAGLPVVHPFLRSRSRRDRYVPSSPSSHEKGDVDCPHFEGGETPIMPGIEIAAELQKRAPAFYNELKAKVCTFSLNPPFRKLTSFHPGRVSSTRTATPSTSLPRATVELQCSPPVCPFPSFAASRANVLLFHRWSGRSPFRLSGRSSSEGRGGGEETLEPFRVARRRVYHGLASRPECVLPSLLASFLRPY